mmetsp:Transcript_91692/g.153654  ORF Transcript_91692/g.153654 Transcript_91692/m.153654 type:complete len:273 (+) Transcript_91692:862-1680(+)
MDTASSLTLPPTSFTASRKSCKLTARSVAVSSSSACFSGASRGPDSFFRYSRTGRYAAAMHICFRSDPEYPAVICARSSSCTSAANASSLRTTCRIALRLSKLGTSTNIRRGIRRNTASSKSPGRLVAASTMTCSKSCDFKPSHAAMNSFFNLRIASCSCSEDRRPSIASTSSIKMMQGANFRAREKTAATNFSASPNHFEVTTDMLMFIKWARASVAIALANMVLPVPGGPNSKIPLQGLRSELRLKSPGRVNGRSTTSRSNPLTFSWDPI